MPDTGGGFLHSLDMAQFLADQSARKSVPDQAQEQYPALNNLGLQYKQSPADANGSMLEFWKPGEPGTADRPRPQEFDINKPGVELYGDKAKPIDILGDVVSHHMIETDPKIAKTYQAFQNSITPQQDALLAQQYQYAQRNNGETRSFDAWKDSSGIPAFFRGHPFQQWPTEFNKQVYTPDQIRLLDGMMGYLSKKR